MQVHAVGLNFRDVLIVLGAYPGDPGLPGDDSDGLLLSTSPENPSLTTGDRVFGYVYQVGHHISHDLPYLPTSPQRSPTISPAFPCHGLYDLH